MNLSRTERRSGFQQVDPIEVGQQGGTLELSVVLPVYQELDVIKTSISQLMEVLSQTDLTYEVIAVNDGSTDGTQEQLLALQTEFANLLRIVTHPYNKGNGAAVKSGIESALGEIIACMDTDGQHDPSDILRMLDYFPEYDLVVGTRTQDYAGVWYRNLANRFYNLLASWLTRFPIQDLTSGYRLFRASVVKKYLHLFPARFSYPTTTTLAFVKGGYNVKYAPINACPRQGSESKLNLARDGWRFLVIIFKIIVLFEPLRIFLPTAFTLFILAFASSVYSVWSLERLYIPNSAVIFFVVGVLVLLLGLIAEQIAMLQITAYSQRK
ncbi:glycosyltransferase family 2 protein [Acidobacteria bacterium AH-259-A15]|nr:glycosyltransferase family 2 protein [Acidobacteria bacterium AH-259-A15]